MPNTGERTFDAGFEFARRLKDREFRDFIKASGWRSGQHVIMATDDTPIRDIIAKMMLHEMEQRALIAIVHEDSEFGFRLITVGLPRRSLQAVAVGEPESVGEFGADAAALRSASGVFGDLPCFDGAVEVHGVEAAGDSAT